MKDLNFNQHVINILKTDVRLVDEENDIQINILRDFVNNFDERLIELLLNDEQTRIKFFVRIKDVYIFKQNDFIYYLDSNVLDGSYTHYANRIGLASGGKFLTDSTDYVLDFPYKDCILEGGQSSEEGNDVYFEYDAVSNDYVERTAKRKEIFYNHIIAKDEIDRLLEPKAFQKVVSYDIDGESIPFAFSRDALLNKKRGLPEDTITDNLIIKGNNLLGLYSIEKELKNKVKLIYIDPPYNTGSDSFKYNDRFNHSTWLTFMYNRLLIAKNLLKEDGVIIVQCSFHEFAYLKVLMNNTFRNHMCDFNIQVRHPDRGLTGDKEFNDVIEYALIFSDNPLKKMPYIEVEKTINDYVFDIEILENEKPEIITCGKKNVEVYLPGQYKMVKKEPSENLFKIHTVRGSLREKNSSGRFFVKYLEPLTHYPPQTLFKVPDMGDDNIDFRYFYSAPLGNKNGAYLQGKPTSTNITRKQYPNFYNFEKEYNNVADEGGVSFRNGKKPEELLKFYIDLFSDVNDIVLDYHLGSGTTAAVSHKMGRQFVGLEQINNQIELSKDRLINVINNEVSGISDLVNWGGGGSFIYVELAKNNEAAKEQIQACNSLEDLNDLFDELSARYFLNYNARVKEFKEKIIHEDNFKALSLSRQKALLARMLDNNQLYVNHSEVEDSRYHLSSDAIRLTKDFYQIKD
ncbi:site-specific DNA-methyltransferase [Sphingobacterium kitahiroshimense]|uniref:site-specific DNA-methyltransferase n=1 Tax=Sphingobacterium sp. B16(2022) TaxID=2914044 RepID=UPI0014388730|nr:site-specific DNA-methyltransferase [Sphingobacterium sp. B16(2022)]NJI71947.1 site-specific DNA-methyltransferase [Sphingobacterium sp. B16(2022)]